MFQSLDTLNDRFIISIHTIMLKYVKLNERWILICEVCIQVGLHVQEIIRNVSKAHLEERLNEGREEDEQSTF